MRALLASLALTLVVAALPSLASAQRAPTRAQVRQLLSGIEDVPRAEDWRRLGDEVLPILIALSQDPSEPPYVRLRAIGASAAFPVPATRTFLLAVARADGQGDLVVREAVRALARGFGASARADLEPFLAHEAPVVREAAARSMAALGGPEVRAALDARLRIERDPTVRRALAR